MFNDNIFIYVIYVLRNYLIIWASGVACQLFSMQCLFINVCKYKYTCHIV